MSDQITIQVDSSEVDSATQALERLATAAERAVRALKELGDTPVVLHRAGEVEKIQIGDPARFPHATQD